MLVFLSHLLNGLSLGCIYALIAVGYTMVYGIIKLINFAHGEFYMFGAYVGFFTLTLLFGGVANGRDLSIFALLTALLLAGGLTGLLAVVVERFVYRPLRKSGRIVALLAALGVSLLMQNGGQQTVGANTRTFPHTFTPQRLPRTAIDAASLKAGETAQSDMTIVYAVATEGGELTKFENIVQRDKSLTQEDVNGIAKKLHDPARLHATLYAYPAVTVNSDIGLILCVLPCVSLGLWFLVQRTRFGRAMRAVAHDFEAAELMGIDVNRVIAGTFFIGAFVAGIGGTLGGMKYVQISPLMGLLPGLKAFVAAVIGGIGSFPGALAGALLLGVAETFVSAYVPNGSLYTNALTFGLLIVMLLVRPSGILGKPVSDKL